MSRVKRFTPGPWEAEGGCVRRPNGEILTCFVDGFVCRGSSLEDYETARLVAAAPDLLEALEGIMHYARLGASVSDVHTSEQPQFVAAEKAIAKAYGEEA